MERNPIHRRFDLDWLRVLAILAVFSLHCSLLFAPDPSAIKNSTTYGFIDDLGDFFGSWGMPLIFIISGASAFHALGKFNSREYIKGLLARLLIPLIVGIFTHIALQVYLENLYKGTFSGSFFEFYPHYFNGMYAFGGNFAWMGLHLWYLEALFIYSLVYFPFFLWVKKNNRGKRAMQYLGNFLAKPGAVYLFALPVILLTSILDPETWGTTALGGWSPLIYPFFYVSGFMIITNERLQASIKRSRWVSLVLGILSLGATDIFWDVLGYPVFHTFGFALGSSLECLSAWCWLLAVLGFGFQHLNRNAPFLRYANEAVLPFYILHYTVIIFIGYFVVQWAIPDFLKWGIVLITSFAISIGFYEALIRRFNPLRFLFGMRLLVKTPVTRKREERLSDFRQLTIDSKEMKP